MSVGVIILAAGKGTRMNSKYQKILHEVGGKPMVEHIFNVADAISDSPPVFITGPGETGVADLFGDRATYVLQAERLGTGHAVMMAEEALKGKADTVMVMNGDMPLVSVETMQRVLAAQTAENAVVIMSVLGEKSSTFGRILRDENGNVTEICEVAQAKQRPNAEEILSTPELNVGEYCFSAEFLWSNIHNLPLRKARVGHEYYITDLIEMAIEQGKGVAAVAAKDADEGLGAGTRSELVSAEKAFRRRAIKKHLANGVTFIDPDQTYIDLDVTIGQDSVIWPNTFIQGDSIIGEDCIIGPNTIIRSATIGDRCVIEQTVVEGVIVPENTNIEPFSHVLPIGDE